MKKTFLLLGVVLLSTMSLCAQEKTAGDVTLEMADGTAKRGYCRTDMVNIVKFFEISAEPKSKRIRYDNDQISRIVFDAGVVYVKHALFTSVKGKKAKETWVRLDYQGKGIALYALFTQKSEMVNKGFRTVTAWNYYISLGEDPAALVATDYLAGGIINQSRYNRTLLNYYFNKRYPQYADFAKRIKDKEFDVKRTPIQVVKAWEESYGN